MGKSGKKENFQDAVVYVRSSDGETMKQIDSILS